VIPQTRIRGLAQLAGPRESLLADNNMATILKHERLPGTRALLLGGLLVCGILASPAGAQSTPLAGAPEAPGTPTHYQPNRFSKRASTYYGVVWGVSSLSVRYAESGEIIRFSYHVLDPIKAQVLSDEKAEPYLVDRQAGVKLVIPTVDKVGKLRQTSKPEEGKSYWMAFSNKGRVVKPGDRVEVVIGQFHADGLVVE
jgi:hypothetical protein